MPKDHVFAIVVRDLRDQGNWSDSNDWRFVRRHFERICQKLNPPNEVIRYDSFPENPPAPDFLKLALLMPPIWIEGTVLSRRRDSTAANTNQHRVNTNLNWLMTWQTMSRAH